jgi:hypothetical protein
MAQSIFPPFRLRVLSSASCSPVVGRIGTSVLRRLQGTLDAPIPNQDDVLGTTDVHRDLIVLCANADNWTTLSEKLLVAIVWVAACGLFVGSTHALYLDIHPGLQNRPPAGRATDIQQLVDITVFCKQIEITLHSFQSFLLVFSICSIEHLHCYK